jgi:diacylglycerol O-acyltransferase / trehalose O-mycolyltransferase
LYGLGTRNWVYWQRELHRAWPLLTSTLRPS